MKYTKELFHKSISVLVAGYFNGTLAHGSCYACAVGNLVAHGLGCKIIDDGERLTIHSRYRWTNDEPYPGSDGGDVNKYGWGAAFATSIDGWTGRKKQDVNIEALSGERVQSHIKATGYEWQDLARIEKAFESADRRRKDVMFNGLMKVVDVLCEIHGMNETEKEESKAMFVKAGL